MKTYQYKGFDASGHPARGLIEALTLKEAREKLVSDGIFAERVFDSGNTVRIGLEARALIYSELSSLLDAGLPLVRALDVMLDSPEMNQTRLFLAGIRDRIKDGQGLASAIGDVCSNVSAFEGAIIESAERSATVGKMLAHLAAFMEDQARIRHRIRGALIYPVIVFLVGIFVSAVMLFYFLPLAKGILTDSGSQMPFLTGMVIAIGNFLARYGALLLVMAGGAGVYFHQRLKRDPEWRVAWDRLIFRVPFLKTGYILLAGMRFCQTLSILLHGGIPMVEAVALSGRATGSGWIALLAGQETEQIRQGGRLSDSIRRIPPLALSLPGLIQVAEAGGGLERMLESAGRRYQDQWERFVNQSLSIMEPVLILIIGGFVLFITLSILLPILSLSQLVGPT